MEEGGNSMKKLRIIRTILICICFAFMATLVIPPLFDAVFNKLTPWIMGMPFLVFYVILVNLAIAIILTLLWNVDKKIEGGEKNE